MKQLPWLLNICTFKMKSNLKTFLILKNDTKTCVITNLIQANIVVGHFIKLFDKTTTCPRQPLSNGPKSGRLIYTGLTVLLH